MSPGLEAGPYLVWAFDLPDPLTRVITAGSCGPSTGSFCLLWSKWEFKQTLLRWSSILRGIITHRVEGRYLCAKKWGAPAGSGRGSTHVSLWVKLGGLQARPSEFHDEMLFLDRWWHGFRSGSQCAAVMVGKWSESRLVGSLILTLG